MKRIKYSTNVIKSKKNDYNAKKLSLYKLYRIYNLNTKCRNKYNKKNVFIIIKRKKIKRAKDDVEDVIKSIIIYVPVMLIEKSLQKRNLINL